MKEWLPILISLVALVVSLAVAWDQRREAQPRLNLRAIASYSERGCPSIRLLITNESSRAITLAPPFVAHLREQIDGREPPKTDIESLLEPGPFVVSLRPNRTSGQQRDGPYFLRPQEAIEFEHDLADRERALLRADSVLVVAVTDYTGRLWTTDFEERSAAQTALEMLREPCLGK